MQGHMSALEFSSVMGGWIGHSRAAALGRELHRQRDRRWCWRCVSHFHAGSLKTAAGMRQGEQSSGGLCVSTLSSEAP